MVDITNYGAYFHETDENTSILPYRAVKCIVHSSLDQYSLIEQLLCI